MLALQIATCILSVLAFGVACLALGASLGYRGRPLSLSLPERKQQAVPSNGSAATSVPRVRV